jgi:hypothetical protein
MEDIFDIFSFFAEQLSKLRAAFLAAVAVSEHFLRVNYLHKANPTN